jgi:hypothetical protein
MRSILSSVRISAFVVVAACGGAAQPAQPASPSGTAVEPSASVVPASDAPAPSVGARPTQMLQPGPNVTPDGVVFNYKAASPAKRKVYLAGNFNSWNPSDDKFLMKDDDGDGTYSIVVKLGPGSYQYKYVIDGAWTKDPYSPADAPDGFGGRNGQFDVK